MPNWATTLARARRLAPAPLQGESTDAAMVSRVADTAKLTAATAEASPAVAGGIPSAARIAYASIRRPRRPIATSRWSAMKSFPSQGIVAMSIWTLVACGGQTSLRDADAATDGSMVGQPDTGSRSDATEAEGDVGPEGGGPGLDGGEAGPIDSAVNVPDGPYITVDASGDCAPPRGQVPAGGTSCCAGSIPCVGQCVEWPNGQIGCECEGIFGGCRADGLTMCCPQLKGCASVQSCFGGGQ
jgi:hypothetical protein